MEIVEVLACEKNEIKLNPLVVYEEKGEDAEGNIMGKLQKKGELFRGNKLKSAGLS